MKSDFAFTDCLWRYWTAPGCEDPAHLRQIKAMLAEPGVLAAALGYCRAMLDRKKWDSRLHTVRQAMDRLIAVPALALCGQRRTGARPDTVFFR